MAEQLHGGSFHGDVIPSRSDHHPSWKPILHPWPRGTPPQVQEPLLSKWGFDPSEEGLAEVGVSFGAGKLGSAGA